MSDALGSKHLVIPDTQVAPGVPMEHLTWVGKYLVDKKPDVVIHLGDHWDMPSLCSYDRGKKRDFNSRRVLADIEAGNEGMDLLMAPLHAYNAQRRKLKEKQYKPRLVLLRGNHEARIDRAIDENPTQLEGIVGDHLFNDVAHGWEVHKFLHVVDIDGISYSHYFYNPNTSRPLGGMISTRIKQVGFSFTMGHQQGKDQAERFLSDGTVQRGLVVGSCYLHDEAYKGPQGNEHWRGVVMKHEVRNGNYDLMEVSLRYLERRYGS